MTHMGRLLTILLVCFSSFAFGQGPAVDEPLQSLKMRAMLQGSMVNTVKLEYAKEGFSSVKGCLKGHLIKDFTILTIKISEEQFYTIGYAPVFTDDGKKTKECLLALIDDQTGAATQKKLLRETKIPMQGEDDEQVLLDNGMKIIITDNVRIREVIFPNGKSYNIYLYDFENCALR